MFNVNVYRLLTVCPERVKQILKDHDEEARNKLLPDFYIQFAQYRYSLRSEYTYALGKYLNLDPQSFKLTIGLADDTQRRGIHKCLGIHVPGNLSKPTITSLRQAIDSKKIREFIELHMIGTRDGPMKLSEGIREEALWKDSVNQVVSAIQTLDAFVIIHHSSVSETDAQAMKAVAIKFHCIPTVFDLHSDLHEMLKKVQVKIPQNVPSCIKERLRPLITSQSPDWQHSDEPEDIFRLSILTQLYPGILWNSAYFMHAGVCLGCRQQFEYLYTTGQIERMIRDPNRTMYGGLRYTRKNSFVRSKRLIGYKPATRQSRVTSLSKPLG